MQENEKLYYKFLKREIENTLESGSLPEAHQQYQYIENKLKELGLLEM